MPKCIPCLGIDLKQALLQEAPELRSLLEKVADCAEPKALELCGRKGRAKSAYQTFIGECLRGKHIKGFGEAPKAMKECAAAYREKRGK